MSNVRRAFMSVYLGILLTLPMVCVLQARIVINPLDPDLKKEYDACIQMIKQIGNPDLNDMLKHLEGDEKGDGGLPLIHLIIRPGVYGTLSVDADNDSCDSLIDKDLFRSMGYPAFECPFRGGKKSSITGWEPRLNPFDTDCDNCKIPNAPPVVLGGCPDLVHELAHAYRRNQGQFVTSPATKTCNGGLLQNESEEAFAVDTENKYRAHYGLNLRCCYSNCAIDIPSCKNVKPQNISQNSLLLQGVSMNEQGTCCPSGIQSTDGQCAPEVLFAVSGNIEGNFFPEQRVPPSDFNHNIAFRATTLGEDIFFTGALSAVSPFNTNSIILLTSSVQSGRPNLFPTPFAAHLHVTVYTAQKSTGTVATTTDATVSLAANGFGKASYGPVAPASSQFLQVETNAGATLVDHFPEPGDPPLEPLSFDMCHRRPPERAFPEYPGVTYYQITELGSPYVITAFTQLHSAFPNQQAKAEGTTTLTVTFENLCP